MRTEAYGVLITRSPAGVPTATVPVLPSGPGTSTYRSARGGGASAAGGGGGGAGRAQAPRTTRARTVAPTRNAPTAGRARHRRGQRRSAETAGHVGCAGSGGPPSIVIGNRWRRRF